MTHANSRPVITSLNEMLQWLRVKPRTFQWDAMLAYDRIRTNRLLMQEYIQRFNSTSFLPPITRLYNIVENSNWEYMDQILLTEPRISFQNSSIANSKAILTMHIMGGVNMSISKPANMPKQITQIDVVDAIQGHKLIGEITLGDVDGEVSNDGRVFINLKNAVNMEVDIRDAAIARSLTGLFFQQWFDQLDEDQQLFVFNELGPVSENDFLDPDKFMIRTFPAEGAASRLSRNYGEGVVLVFVAGKGSGVGTAPVSTAGWIYPIPDDRSVSMLFGNHFVIRTLLQQGIRAMAEAVTIEFDNDTSPDAPAGNITVRSGSRRRDWTPWYSFLHLDQVMIDLTLPLGQTQSYGSAEFKVSTTDEMLVVGWSGNTQSGDAHGKGDFNFMVSEDRIAQLEFEVVWELQRTFLIDLKQDGSVGFEEDASKRVHFFKVRPSSQVYDEIRPVIAEVVAHIEEFVAECLEDAFNSVLSPLQEINLFRLNSLLFRSSDIALTSAHYTHDMALFGNLATRQTSFELDPLDANIAPASTLQLRTLPEMKNVTWEVERVQGFDGGVGSIDANGLYSAPSSDEIPKHYTMVVITATTPEFTSKAVVRVLKRAVVCNPLVVSTGLGGAWTRFRAGSLDGGELTWTLNTVSDARLEDTPPPDADVEFEPGDRFYYSGPEEERPGENMIVLDEIVVSNAKGDSHTSSIVVIKGLMYEVSIVKGSMTPDGVTLSMHGPDGPIESGVQWSVLAGGGEVNQDGVFTVDKSSEHKYAVVVAKLHFPGFGWFGGYVILPIPLFDPDTISRLLLD